MLREHAELAGVDTTSFVDAPEPVSLAVIGLGLVGQLTAQILRAAGCRVVYTNTAQWGGGFTADVTVRNTGTRPTSGWTRS